MLPWGTCPSQACNSSLWWHFSGPAQAFTRCLFLCAVLLGLQSLFTGASLQGPDVGVIETPESDVWLASAHRPCFLSAHPRSLLVLALLSFLGPQAQLLALLSFLPAPPSELCGPTTPFRGPLRSVLIGASSCCGFLFWFVMGPGMEPRALHILGKCCSVKLYPQPCRCSVSQLLNPSSRSL